VAIGLSPAEAGREVLTWLDPGRAPRLEWATVMRRAEFLAAFGPHPPEVLQDASGGVGFNGFIRTENLPPVLVVVGASTLGVGSQRPWPGDLDADSSQLACRSRGEGVRERMMAVFDAVGGQAVAARGVDASLQDEEAVWRAVRPLDSRPIPRSTATPTMTPRAGTRSDPSPPPPPTEPPPSKRLTRANLPPALEQVFRNDPLKPGSSWTWRTTDRAGAVRWSAQIVTETVEAVWLLAEDTALVRERLRYQPISASAGQPRERVIYRHVRPNGVSTIDGPGPDATSTPGPGRVVLEPVLSRDDPESMSFVHGDSLVHDVTVSTRAGTFHGCARFGVVGGAGWGTYRWFCPGVGYVRDERFSCYTNGALFGLDELVRWHVADW
jgi:hypothetical protein